MTKIEQAKAFAHKAHDIIEQKRKYTGEPYWVHTDAVAEIVTAIGGTEDMIVAAHLHDILEDVTPIYPGYSEGQILVQFGEHVLALVKELTDVYTKVAYPKLNRAERHALENERLAKTSVEARTIKVCDLINNTASIVEHDKDFAKVYLREKMDLLGMICDGVPAELVQRASMQVLVAAPLVGLHIPLCTNKVV